MPKKKGTVSRQTLWQRKHRAMGLCVVCSEPAHKGWRCVKHYEQHKIAMRLRYIPKVRGRYDVGGSVEFLAAAGREAERRRQAAAGPAGLPPKQSGRKQSPAEAIPKAASDEAGSEAKARPRRRARIAPGQ